MEKSDREIIAEVLTGNTEEFGKLIERYGNRIYGLVLHIAGNREDAEELTSDTFLKAYARLAFFRGRSAFSTWLYRIAYNTAISFRR